MIRTAFVLLLPLSVCDSPEYQLVTRAFGVMAFDYISRKCHRYMTVLTVLTMRKSYTALKHERLVSNCW
jgi:hypothetical protein